MSDVGWRPVGTAWETAAPVVVLAQLRVLARETVQVASVLAMSAPVMLAQKLERILERRQRSGVKRICWQIVLRKKPRGSVVMMSGMRSVAERRRAFVSR